MFDKLHKTKRCELPDYESFLEMLYFLRPSFLFLFFLLRRIYMVTYVVFKSDGLLFHNIFKTGFHNCQA